MVYRKIKTHLTDDLGLQ